MNVSCLKPFHVLSTSHTTEDRSCFYFWIYFECWAVITHLIYFQSTSLRAEIKRIFVVTTVYNLRMVLTAIVYFSLEFFFTNSITLYTFSFCIFSSTSSVIDRRQILIWYFFKCSFNCTSWLENSSRVRLKWKFSLTFCLGGFQIIDNIPSRWHFILKFTWKCTLHLWGPFLWLHQVFT